MVSVSTQVLVLADLLSGVSVSETARRYDLSRPTVRVIRAKFTDVEANGGEVRLSVERNREEIDALLLTTLRESLEAQKAILQVVGDEKYLKRQRGRDNAKILDVISAFTLRLLSLYEGRASKY